MDLDWDAEAHEGRGQAACLEVVLCEHVEEVDGGEVRSWTGAWMRTPTRRGRGLPSLVDAMVVSSAGGDWKWIERLYEDEMCVN